MAYRFSNATPLCCEAASTETKHIKKYAHIANWQIQTKNEKKKKKKKNKKNNQLTAISIVINAQAQTYTHIKKEVRLTYHRECLICQSNSVL